MSGGRGSELRLVATLTLAGALSGLAVVGAYKLSLPAITANQAAALERAVFEVLPGATRMEALAWRDGKLQPAGASAGDAPVTYAGRAEDGRLVGYAIAVAGAGFADTIKLLYGYDPTRRRVVGMAVLESRETPGLGDKIYKDTRFVGEFRDLAVEPVIELIKGHGEEPHQVDAITGATISSRAVVRILNEGNREWLERFPESGAGAPGGAGGGGG